MPTFASIVFTVKDPFLVDRNIAIQVGAIDDQGILYHITLDPALSVTPITADSILKFAADSIIITPAAEGTVAYLLSYEGVEAVLSFFATPGIVIPTQQLLQRIVYNTLPPQCYTLVKDSVVTAKLVGIGAVYEDLYSDLQTVLLNFFPPFTDNTQWSVMLNDFYSWQNSFDFGLVVQLFNNLPQTLGNIFDISLVMSEYIFARFGLDLYVYILENAVTNVENWILGESILGETTILSVSSGPLDSICIFIRIAFLPPDIINELTLFAQKVVPATIQIIVAAEPDFSQYDLLVEVGDVYPLDPRLFVPFALKYDPTAVFNAVALCNPFNPFFAIGLDYAPAGGTYDTGSPPFNLTATGTFDFENVIYMKDVTVDTIFISDNLSVLTVTDNIVTIVGAGTANIEATWEGFMVSHSFTVTALPAWILGVSVLGTDTILIN